MAETQKKNELNSFCKACNAPIGNYSLGVKNDYTLLACKACGSVTVSPFPTEKELIKFYQSYEGTTDYRAKKDKKIARAKKRIIRLIKNAPGKRFLDVGCNYGFTVQAAKELKLKAHGIDIDATAVQASQKMFGKEQYECISVQDYADAGHQADIIYTSEVIEHVPDPDLFVKSISKILTKGGLLYLTTPDGNHFMIPHDFTKWEAVMPPEHIIYYSRKGIKILLEKHGFKVKKFFFSFKPGIRLIAEKIK